MQSSFFVSVGRVSLALSVLSLIGAWITQLTGNSFVGMSQTHLFSDATVLALLGIGFLVDGIVHKKEEAKS
jgi:hypothetical protein